MFGTPLSCHGEPMRLRYALVQDRSATTADEILQAVAKQSVALEGHQRFTVLPALTDIVGATVLASCDWDLFHILFSSQQCFANTQYRRSR